MGPRKSEEVPDLTDSPNFKFVPQSGDFESGISG